MRVTEGEREGGSDRESEKKRERVKEMQPPPRPLPQFGVTNPLPADALLLFLLINHVDRPRGITLTLLDKNAHHQV